MLTLWKVSKRYISNGEVEFDVMPHNFFGHLKCCIKWYGIKYIFKDMYLTEKKANKIAAKKNNELKERKYI